MNMRNKGFTIVELLIVIVVIGILAAIVIVAFNGVQARAHQTAIKNDLAAFTKKVELYKAENGAYPVNATQLDSMDFKATQQSYRNQNNFYYRSDNQGRWFLVGVTAPDMSGYYLRNGKVVDASGVNSVNSTAEFRSMVTEYGTDGSAITVIGSTGHDQSGGNGWLAWAY